MAFLIGLAQTRHPTDGDVIGLVERVARQAEAAGVDLLVFPESLMVAYEAPVEDFVARAQRIDGPFCRAVDDIARKYGLWVVYTMSERHPAGGLPFNTAVITDASGTRQAAYRKLHLFDSTTTHESSRMSPGDALPHPVQTPFAKVGVGICYDLRFPELARHEALLGAEMIAYPSAWVDGSHKLDQWRTLLAARAVENGMYVAGACRPDEGYVGHSLLVDPNGEIVAEAGDGEELLVATIDIDEVRRTRSRIPVLDHLRPDVYAKR